MRQKRVGATLMELLFVISILGLLISMLLPGVFALRRSSLTIECKNNLRQIGLALSSFENSNNRLPSSNFTIKNDLNEAFLNWQVGVSPFLEQERIYSDAVSSSSQDSITLHNPPHAGLKSIVKQYVCPTDNRLLTPSVDSVGFIVSFSSYLGNGGLKGSNGPFASPVGVSLSQITDGLSNTIICGERPPPSNFQAGAWYPGYIGYGGGPNGPNGPNGIIFLGGVLLSRDDYCNPDGRVFGRGKLTNFCDRYHYWSLHSEGSIFLFCDGSVKSIETSESQIANKLFTINGGEIE